MTDRRKFLKTAALGGAALSLGINATAADADDEKNKKKKRIPLEPFKGGLVLSTWDAGISANQAAWNTLTAGGKALDMAEKGVNDTEADFRNLSVGLGGLPDREGHTTLDACIMDSNGMAGSVMFLEHIKHPASVARRVMEKTPHVQLVGEGAYRFAISEGFPHDDFVSEEAQNAWKKWLKESKYQPIINIENHDTIGLLAMDNNGDIAGACTTSGLAYKIRGRVGDSPIIGAGLYVDNEIGAATSTGLGEAVVRTCGSFLVVELMRQGATPQQACEEAVIRIQKRHRNFQDFQVGFLAVNKAGEIGAYAVQPGFTYALYKNGENKLFKSGSLIPSK
ncbi:MAG: N(4)-(beta-N-acetylglucosaminyl)-L-asparaginase [Flavobacteriales bacterium]|nr:N(4)-(beta-N-acetylglucosaminyl)-L-asparaginase [Flavobacteriales bacterium]